MDLVGHYVSEELMLSALTINIKLARNRIYACIILAYVCNAFPFRLLGMDRVGRYVREEWVRDIMKNQIPSILGGVGPMHSLVQIGQ